MKTCNRIDIKLLELTSINNKYFTYLKQLAATEYLIQPSSQAVNTTESETRANESILAPPAAEKLSLGAAYWDQLYKWRTPSPVPTTSLLFSCIIVVFY